MPGPKITRGNFRDNRPQPKKPKGMSENDFKKKLGSIENTVDDIPTRLSKSDEDNKKVETLQYEPSKRTLPPGKSILMKAKGGRIGYKHGGAAKRGRGCEIK